MKIPMARQVTLFAIVVLLITLSANAIAQGEGADEKAKRAQFLRELSRWVRDTLSVTESNNARYVLTRIGCVLIVRKGENRKDEFLPIAEQIRKCGDEIADFDCRATRSLIRDMKVLPNRYYDYCKDR
jgi:hypothetical protein